MKNQYSELKITTDGNRTKIRLDGVQLRNVTKFMLEQNAGEIATLKLEMAITPIGRSNKSKSEDENVEENKVKTLKEVTVTRENDEVIAHVFYENDEIQGIMENGFKVSVDGIELKKDTL